MKKAMYLLGTGLIAGSVLSTSTALHNSSNTRMNLDNKKDQKNNSYTKSSTPYLKVINGSNGIDLVNPIDSYMNTLAQCKYNNNNSIIAAGDVFVSAVKGTDTTTGTEKYGLIGIDANSGKVLWSFKDFPTLPTQIIYIPGSNVVVSLVDNKKDNPNATLIYVNRCDTGEVLKYNSENYLDMELLSTKLGIIPIVGTPNEFVLYRRDSVTTQVRFNSSHRVTLNLYSGTIEKIEPLKLDSITTSDTNTLLNFAACKYNNSYYYVANLVDDVTHTSTTVSYQDMMGSVGYNKNAFIDNDYRGATGSSTEYYVSTVPTSSNIHQFDQTTYMSLEGSFLCVGWPIHHNASSNFGIEAFSVNLVDNIIQSHNYVNFSSLGGNTHMFHPDTINLSCPKTNNTTGNFGFGASNITLGTQSSKNALIKLNFDIWYGDHPVGTNSSYDWTSNKNTEKIKMYNFDDKNWGLNGTSKIVTSKSGNSIIFNNDSKYFFLINNNANEENGGYIYSTSVISDIFVEGVTNIAATSVTKQNIINYLPNSSPLIPNAFTEYKKGSTFTITGVSTTSDSSSQGKVIVQIEVSSSFSYGSQKPAPKTFQVTLTGFQPVVEITDNSLWMWVGIGAGALVLIIAIIVIAIVLNNKKRSKEVSEIKSLIRQQGSNMSKKLSASSSAKQLGGPSGPLPQRGPAPGPGSKPMGGPGGPGPRPMGGSGSVPPKGPAPRTGGPAQKPGASGASRPMPAKVEVNAPPRSLAPKRK